MEANRAKGNISVNTLSFDGKIGTWSENTYQKSHRLWGGIVRGMDGDQLATIAPIMLNAIRKWNFRGTGFGSKKWKSKLILKHSETCDGFDEPVTLKTDFDLASLTKVMATLQAVMMLYNQKKLDIEKPLKYYLPEMDSTDKGNIPIKDLLMHQAGLKAFLFPFIPKPFPEGNIHRNFTLKPTPKTSF